LSLVEARHEGRVVTSPEVRTTGGDRYSGCARCGNRGAAARSFGVGYWAVPWRRRPPWAAWSNRLPGLPVGSGWRAKIRVSRRL